MKITKRQLRRIIREEYTRILRESQLPSADAAYEDGFVAYHEGREEPDHWFRDFEDDWYAGYDDARNSPAGDYDPDPTSYDPEGWKFHNVDVDAMQRRY